MFLSFEKTGNRVEDDSFFLEAISSYIMPNKTKFGFIGNLSNVSALIKEYFEDINWAGFYLFDGDKLILGPFQGEPACFEIKVGSGVCGTAFKKEETLIVDDVSTFPGHIACSAKSKSEIVVPIFKDGKPVGVIDIDSPVLSRFSEADASLLESVASIVSSLF